MAKDTISKFLGEARNAGRIDDQVFSDLSDYLAIRDAEPESETSTLTNLALLRFVE